MERLSGLDAGFLHIESPTQPLNVCCLLRLDTSTVPGGYTFDKMRDALEVRITAIPQFREKLMDNQLNLDHPVWADDEEFDLDRHVTRVALPSPGGRDELSDLCGRLAALPLDRDKPLWEMWVIEGLDETEPEQGGSVAVMLKTHHAAVDGVAGAGLLAELATAEPDPSPPEPQPGPGPVNVLELAATGLVRLARRPWQMAAAMPSTVSTVIETLGRVRTGATMARPFAAPSTPFNANVSMRRNVAFADLDLDAVKAVKNRFGVTVNDVVLALCSTAVRDYLMRCGDLPDKSVVAMIPSSVRDLSDRPGRNQVSGMFCHLHTAVSDPVERLRAIGRTTAVAKDHSGAIAPTLLHDLTQFGARLFGPVLRLAAIGSMAHTPAYNLIVSNVAGPQSPLYFLGAAIAGLYPLGPIFHGAALNMTVMSMHDRVGVGIISCPDLMPDLWELADGFPAALQELLGAA